MSSKANETRGPKSRGGKAQGTPEAQEAASGEESKPAKKPSKHTWEGSYLIKKHKPGCVNRHIGYYAKSNPCSHRGQARKRAVANFTVYLWDEAQTDGADPWDPRTRGNYERSASSPFPHEAHHVVAAAELSNAIKKASEGIEPEGKVLVMMRGGLLKEKYNVNNEHNMLILPMDLEATLRLGLPLHRKTPSHRFHNTYSDYVESELVKKFGWLKNAAEKHEVPPYQETRESLEALAAEIHPKILDAGQKLKDGDMSEYDLDSLSSRIFGNARAAAQKGMKSGSRP